MAAAPETAEPHPVGRVLVGCAFGSAARTVKGCARACGPLDDPGPRVVEAVSFGASAMKSRSWKLTCWFWLYRQTRGLRWFVALVWPLQDLPRRLAIELELRRCERRWKRG